MKNNQLTAEAYTASGVRVLDDDLPRASGLRFSTIYPGGLYADGSLYAARKRYLGWRVRGAQRLVFRSGQKIVYEGKISNLDDALEEAAQGKVVAAQGYWGAGAGVKGWRKRWADRRISEEIWPYQTGTTGAGDQSCTLDRLARLRFTPKGVAWANADYAAVRYAMPVGETIKRLTYNYDLQEAAQVWEISVWRSTDASSWTQMTNVSGETYAVGTTTVITASGTGSIDVTLGTPSRYLEFRFYSRAAQTPVEDGTYYGEFSSIVVYGETGSINLTEIVKDCGGASGSRLDGILSTSEALIASNTYDLTTGGFVADDWVESLAEIMMRAAAFGDSSQLPWAVGIRASDLAPDSLPILFAEQYPALTDYDYTLKVEEADGGFTISRAFDPTVLHNWIVVEYTDLNGVKQYVTPDDDATLKDATSATDYGERFKKLTIATTSQSNAINAGRRYLAQHKDPQYLVSGPIKVRGGIRTKGENKVPACRVQAGKRLRIENYLQDLSGTGLTYIISKTDYDDDEQLVAMSLGVPDDLAVAFIQGF